MNVCMSEYLRDGLKHIRRSFNEFKNYEHWVVSEVLNKLKINRLINVTFLKIIMIRMKTTFTSTTI